MLKYYAKWKDLALRTLESEVLNVKKCEDAELVVVSGMGGSGIVGDYLSSLADETGKYPVFVVKDFSIPKWIDSSRTFIVSISYSGETLETIKAFTYVSDLAKCIGVVTSDGKLADLAKSYSVPLLLLERGYVPRAAFPALLFGTFKLLHEVGIDILPLDIVKRSVNAIDIDRAKSISEKLASFLVTSKYPLIVAPWKYRALAIRFKNELNENSKVPAKVEVIPELFHNDIVGWEQKKFADKAILITGSNSMNKELVEFYRGFLEDVGFETFVLKLEGEDYLQELLYGTLCAGVASVLLASELGVDPLKTRSISSYKKFLGKLVSSA
ncbi:MAG: bifunctional phosphoglucose/phosphomannose isomerase [Thermoprotei archaeon]|nr:MAG: bifunctional phosphoglucose/phosphomannose isomerase [Thermoprotei archaeon]